MGITLRLTQDLLGSIRSSFVSLLLPMKTEVHYFSFRVLVLHGGSINVRIPGEAILNRLLFIETS